MSISASLGEQREVSLPSGTVRYRERGSGEPLLFVHGALVNGDLWRNVVPPLSDRYRCLTPDWPLGSHQPALAPEADLSLPGLARIVIEFLDALGIGSAAIAGNDTGGAICQIVATEHAQRVTRLILTDCDAFDICPPRMFAYLKVTARVPGAIYLLAQSMRLRPNRRLPIAFGWLSKRRIPNDVMDAYVGPLTSDAGVRRDATKLLKGLSPRYTLEAARRLPELRIPALIAWARDDKFFPFSYGQRLAEAIPGAQFEAVEDSLTYVPEDQPERLAELIGRFLQTSAKTQEVSA
ncbi:MAG: alpha/beta hydrolase [Dehalococcoidia bacterium]